MKVCAVIVVIGNDGTGKSSTVNRINKRFEQLGIVALERSQRQFAQSKGITIDPSFVDQHTLKYAFEPDDIELVETIDVQQSSVPVYWVMLDAPVATLQQRLKDRKTTDAWESPKALFYYRKRFLEIAALQGVPVVDSLKYDLRGVVNICISIVTDPKYNGYYRTTKLFALKSVDQMFFDLFDIETRICSYLRSTLEHQTFMDDVFGHLKQSDPLIAQLAEKLGTTVASYRFNVNIVARYLARGTVVSDDETKTIVVYRGGTRISLPDAYGVGLQLAKEGESKKIFRLLTNNPFLRHLALIVLKPTIYSHSKQATGEIDHLDTIRAHGTKMFLEMMYRNGLDHTYVAIHDSYVFSNFLAEVPPVEIVAKGYCEGTDKHSYHGMGDIASIVLPSRKYTCGPYVRFDWRNPNHVDKVTGKSASDSPYYYLVESFIGKERFLEQFLQNDSIVPMGDKTVHQDLVETVIETSEARCNILKIFLTIQYYFRKAELEVIDACFMLDRTGTVFWSEINQDCMRIRSTVTDTSYDKDIWRAGGSRNKDQLVAKWTCFNEMMFKMFQSDRFHTTELYSAQYPFVSEVDRLLQRAKQHAGPGALTIPKSLLATYRRMIPKTRKRVIVTLDLYNGTPVLVQSGHVYQQHSNGNIDEAMERITIFPDILVVDLNGAIDSPTPLSAARDYLIVFKSGMTGRMLAQLVEFFGEDKFRSVQENGYIIFTTEQQAEQAKADFSWIDRYEKYTTTLSAPVLHQSQENVNNRAVIKRLASKYYVHTGGGLRTLEDIEDVLKSSVRRVVVSSADDDIIKKIPKQRLIVELSINDATEVLIHGRKTNTQTKFVDRIAQLVALGNVEAISITFHETEGHMKGIPRKLFQTLYFKIPQSIEKVIIAGGISTLDDLRFLWSFPRVVPQLGSAIWNRLITVGQIYDEMMNYDENGLVSAIVQDVDGQTKGLVWMNSESVVKTCNERFVYRFSREHNCVMKKGESSGNEQYVHKVSADCDSDAILVTVDTSKPFCHTGNYSCFSLQTVVKANLSTLTDHIKSKMSSDSYSGMMQQNPGLPLAKLLEEFWEIVTANDTQVTECSDLLVHLLMYMNGIGISLSDILNELNARRWDPRLTTVTKPIVDTNTFIIAVTPSKYCSKTDDFIREHLGIKLIRGEGRSLKVDCEVVDAAKCQQFFGNKIVRFVAARPKDMPGLLATGRIDFAVTYETVTMNAPKVYSIVLETIDPTISLALIGRTNENIDITKWSEQNKALIAAEHVWHVSDYFHKKGIHSSRFHLDRILGSSEGFLVNTVKYHLCDAIVESGKTLEENGLKIWDTILPKGTIRIGLYRTLVVKK